MSIVCTGSVAYDYLMTFPGLFKDYLIADQLDKVSLSFLVDSMTRQRGGTAPNIAYTLAMLGEEPILMGTVGEDFSDYRGWLESQGIDTTFTRTIEGDFTASFFCNTDQSNAQIASFYTGAMRHASKVSLKELKTKPDIVLVSANDPKAMDRYVAECGELDLFLAYDPGQQCVRSDEDELRRGAENAQSMFVNEYEYELLRKRTGLTEAQILNQVKFLVVTLAEKGCCIYVGDEKVYVDAVAPAQILDPTGVGDAFRGGFLSGYRRGFDWKVCGQMGALAATYCLEQRGTTNHHYTRQDYVNRFRQNFDDEGMLDALL
jgi:adenosine kinase